MVNNLPESFFFSLEHKNQGRKYDIVQKILQTRYKKTLKSRKEN